MDAHVMHPELKRGLSIVSHAVAAKSTLPVLSNILIATDQGRLKLAATNLEIGITCWIVAKINQEGAITIPAKLLSDVVGSLPGGTISLSVDTQKQTLKLTCANFETTIKGIESDEFPVIPKMLDPQPIATIPTGMLRETIDQVAIAAAKDDTRPVLMGVFIQIQDNQASFSAADGFRLARRTIELPEPVAKAYDMVVPARALQELAKIISGMEGTVEMTATPGGGQILFHTQDIDLLSRLIEGKFPDIDRVVPAQYTTRTILETSDLAKAVKLASYFSSAASTADIVRMEMTPGDADTPGTLMITANAAEVGDNKGTVDGAVHGKAGKIALNSKFLAEAINAIKTPQIALETQAERNPAVLRPVGTEGYVHVIMPMTIR